ncbi:hypothetical protein [Sphingobacterium faecale]|uniref:DNA-binding protein n=1 Tax=Sphingobacterium faecale TaxID=2803775 RepID=A0ABS1R2W3_9SPHI|nr:hypothetical protein [Sphingobacterium faecale]MBL1408071.1 hypothetical protein [Sphingobacterium faecale]MBL1408221.1 hypothetical protein [Sphingobacterium faecale]
MENILQQLVIEIARSNDLSEKQYETFLVQQAILQKQGQLMELLQRRFGIMEDLMLKMCEILDRDLLSLLDQPLLFKQDVMKKLCISDATFRNYVADEKLDPMKLGKTEYFFARDLAKQLLKTRKGHQ